MVCKNTKQISLLFLSFLLSDCITQFIPETDEDKDLLVVEGLITDQLVSNTVKISKSLPLGTRNLAKPLKGCTVRITDDLGQSHTLRETKSGTYITDSLKFRGVVGRRYTLYIKTPAANKNLSYQSFPMIMRAVPPVDSVYYEKVTIRERTPLSQAIEGCQVYLNTHDAAGTCRFYRWEFTETWEFRLPYEVPNKICWITDNSDKINVKSTSALKEDRIQRYPVNFISNTSDRLKVKYSMLVHQYSLNENEYIYWEKLQNTTEEVGSLYDITPAAIPSNIWCIEDQKEKVLGYFSVSARSSKRIFIKEYFSGQIDLYGECPSDTIMGLTPIPNLNLSTWVIEDHLEEIPPFRVITTTRSCADCTTRGTNKEPAFWKEAY